MANDGLEGLYPGEAARVVGGAIRAAWRESRGKSGDRQVANAQRIRDRADKRAAERIEIQKAAKAAKEKARLDAKKKAAIDRATRKYK